jgi:hypothetical protein
VKRLKDTLDFVDYSVTKEQHQWASFGLSRTARQGNRGCSLASGIGLRLLDLTVLLAHALTQLHPPGSKDRLWP